MRAAAPSVLDLPQPYLLFLGDTTEPGYAKTAVGLKDWAADQCVGEYGLQLGFSSRAQQCPSGPQDPANSVERIALSATVPAGLLLDALAAQVELVPGESDDVEGIMSIST